MKRLVVLGVTVSVLLAAAALSRPQNTTTGSSANGDVQVQVEGRNPCRHPPGGRLRIDIASPALCRHRIEQRVF